MFARRHYAVRYEGARLIRVIGAAVLAMLAGIVLPGMPHLAGFLARGTAVVAVFAGLLWLTGFLRPTERAILGGVARRLAGRTVQ